RTAAGGHRPAPGQFRGADRWRGARRARRRRRPEQDPAGPVGARLRPGRSRRRRSTPVGAMTLSDLSVRRPVFAAVAAIILCVVGLAAFATLPVRELPSVDPPV